MRVQWLTHRRVPSVLAVGLLTLGLVIGWQVFCQQTKSDFVRLYLATGG